MYSHKDSSSQASIHSLRLQSLHLNWLVDFNSRIISGTAIYEAESSSSNGLQEIIFDQSGLKIHSIAINHEKVPFSTTDTTLLIHLSSRVVSGTSLNIAIDYETSPEASAVQWLDPAATKGGKYPYVFTQSQAIHARSMFPSFDSPGVKVAYTASVTVPSWCTALMSALLSPWQSNDAKSSTDTRTFIFSQPVPVPAYLVALAAGDLASVDVSPRVKVWAEPAVVEKAAWEFGQTESFLAAAEELTCEYLWGRYDILCLPPSFPYG